MKFSSLFLFLLLSLQAYSKDLQRTVSFNFSTPQALNPSITPSKVNGSSVPLGQYTFTAQSAQIDFGYAAAAIAPEITTFVNPYTNEVSYFLTATSGSKVIISAVNGATLDAITFEGTMGGLALEHGQPGATSGSMGREWTDINQEHPTSVSFMNSTQNAEITKITVTYTESVVVLKPIVSSYTDGDTISSFKSLSLTFDRDIFLNNANQISMTYNGEKQSTTVSTLGKVATISVPATLTTDGIVSISIPASSFRDTEQPYSSITDPTELNTKGYENVALRYTFTLRAARNVFEYVSVDPVPGQVEKVPEIVTLKFDNDVTIAENASVKLYQNGTAKYPVTIAVDEDDHSVVHLSYNHNGEITEPGVWSIVVPEKTIHNPFIGDEVDDRWNPEFTLTYIIPEPEPEPEPEATETRKVAEELIGNMAYTGVGYPKADSETRTALAQILAENPLTNDAEENARVDALLKEAIAAFYNDTNVNMPELNKWYTIQGVNSTEKSFYLAYADNGVSLSSNAGEAAAFKVAEVAVGTLVFETSDGKYLHVLTPSNEYVGTSSSNVTETSSAVNKLTLSKLVVAEADPMKIFGKFTISGPLYNAEGMVTSISTIDYTGGTIVDNPASTIYFNDQKSSAFILKETKNPTTVIPTVVLSPTVIESDTEVMTLSFTNVDKVKLDNTKAPYFLNSDGAKVSSTAESILTTVAGSDNVFIVHADGLDGIADTQFYTLVLPANTFNYDGNELTVNPTELRVRFQITGFNYNYNVISWLEDNERTATGRGYAADIELNSFVIFSQVNAPYSGLVADPTKVVRLTRYYTNQVIRTGHFEPYPEFSKLPGYQDYQAIRLVLDSPIEAGELRTAPGIYAYNIPQGTYGDLNFGSYISGDISIAKSSCIANAPKVFTVDIDNDKATGVHSIESAQFADDVMYDLMGRRVDQGSKKPGLYIVNGRKVVIR